jgi:hypothetical protein
MVKELQNIVDMNKELFNTSWDCYQQYPSDFPTREVEEFFKSHETRKHIRNLMLHFSDISYPMKQWEVCCTWAGLVQEELWMQGDREMSLGLPVQLLNDRKKVSLEYGQICFIEFFVVPFSLVTEKILPATSAFTDTLLDNMGQWISRSRSSEGPDRSYSNASEQATTPGSMSSQVHLWDRVAALEVKRHTRVSANMVATNSTLLRNV